jgi:hypothetical protein
MSKNPYPTDPNAINHLSRCGIVHDLRFLLPHLDDLAAFPLQRF